MKQALAIALTGIFFLLVGCSSPTTTVSNSSKSATTYAIVLDSLNGSPVSGATITVSDSSGTVIHTDTTDGLGAVSSFLLVSGASYSISATKAGLAASAMQGYVASDGATVALYCHPIGISGVSAIPPKVEYIEYSIDGGTTWATLANGSSINGSFRVKVSVLGVVAIKATASSGFGVGIDLDKMPTAQSGYNKSTYPSLVTTETDSVKDSATNEFRTVVIFDLFGETFRSGQHTMELVAYDVANNRVEKRVSFTLN